MLFIHRYLLDDIAPLSMYKFRSPPFCNEPLQSGFWSTKSIKELISERKNKIMEYNDNASQGKSMVETMKSLHKASILEDKLSDKSKNREMNDLIEMYPSFFDDESGNTRKEGINELKSYLKQEERAYRSKCIDLKKNIDEIQQELTSRKEVEETTKTLFPIISIYHTIIFRAFLAIFSLCIFFNFLGFDLKIFFSIPDIIIPDIIIPTIVTSTVYFLWKSYRIYSKIKNYYTISKWIYIYCKKKIHFFYKKIYSFYKKFK